jgi:hypothetical protein
MVRAGISLPALQHLMGHSQIHTTMLYVELAPQDVWRDYARAVAKRTHQTAGTLTERGQNKRKQSDRRRIRAESRIRRAAALHVAPEIHFLLAAPLVRTFNHRSRLGLSVDSTFRLRVGIEHERAPLLGGRLPFLLFRSPAMAMIAAPSLRASISPLKRWVTPGPAVPHTATGWPVRYASATAANTPYSSWRTWITQESSDPPFRSSRSREMARTDDDGIGAFSERDSTARHNLIVRSSPPLKIRDRLGVSAGNRTARDRSLHVCHRVRGEFEIAFKILWGPEEFCPLDC